MPKQIIVLKENLVDQKNLLEQLMISVESAIYIIRLDYDLNGIEIEIPQNCVLDFQGGKFYNGTVKFDNTLLKGDIDIKCTLKGFITNREVYVKWFYEEHAEINDTIIWHSRLNDIFNFCNNQNSNPSQLIRNYLQIIIDSGEVKLISSQAIYHKVKIAEGSRIVNIKNDPAQVNYLLFKSGFEAGLYYCIDSDDPTQFFGIKEVYPQWFGECGIKSVDSTKALKRAFLACRGAGGAEPNPDINYGCAKIYIPRGYYKCNNVDVYANCIVEGELSMATSGSCLVQLNNNEPALRIHCKNYSIEEVAATLIDSENNNGFKSLPTNVSYGIGTFNRIVFKSDKNNSGDNPNPEPIIKFLSPRQSDEILDSPGFSYLPIGFTDYNFELCWFQYSYSSCIYVDDTLLDLQLIDCTFDVVNRGLHFSGTSNVMLRCINTQFYYNAWGAIKADSKGTFWANIKDSWFRGCGTASATELSNKFAIYIFGNVNNNSNRSLHLDNCSFEKLSSEENGITYMYNGGLRVEADILSVNNCMFKNLDRIGGIDEYYKYLEIHAKDIKITNNIFIIGELQSYTFPRIIGIMNNEVDNVIVSNNIFNSLYSTSDSNKLDNFIFSYEPLTGCIITNNSFKGYCNKYISSNIGSSGNIVTNNANYNHSIIQGSTPSGAPNVFKKGDIVVNDNLLNDFYGWICTRIDNGYPTWKKIGIPQD